MMKFTKMHGLGNDFIVVAGEKQLPKNSSELARRICNRHFGVGGDGLVFILPSEKGDVRMRIINSDGSEAEQCGNAVRCVAWYCYERFQFGTGKLAIETQAGLQYVELPGTGTNTDLIRVDMGKPRLAGKEIPTAVEGETVVEHPVKLGEKTFFVTGVSMGNPHGVIFVEDADTFPVEVWGPKLEQHPFFPEKANVEFVTLRSPHELDMRVWERGVGRTMACGTGACAALVASVLTGKTDRQATVHLQGGVLEIEWSKQDDHVYMTGPAKAVFEGEWLG